MICGQTFPDLNVNLEDYFDHTLGMESTHGDCVLKDIGEVIYRTTGTDFKFQHELKIGTLTWGMFEET